MGVGGGCFNCRIAPASSGQLGTDCDDAGKSLEIFMTFKILVHTISTSLSVDGARCESMKVSLEVSF